MQEYAHGMSISYSFLIVYCLVMLAALSLVTPKWKEFDKHSSDISYELWIIFDPLRHILDQMNSFIYRHLQVNYLYCTFHLPAEIHLQTNHRIKCKLESFILTEQILPSWKPSQSKRSVQVALFTQNKTITFLKN